MKNRINRIKPPGIRRPAVWIAAAFLLGVCLAGAFADSAGSGDPAIRDGTDVTLTGRVWRREARENGSLLYITDVRLPSEKSDDSNEINPREKLLIYLDETEKIPIGQRIKVKGEYHPFERARNPGNFEAKDYYESLGIAARVYADEAVAANRRVEWPNEWLTRLRESASATLYALLDDKKASVLGAVILGEKGMLDADVKELYQENGIAHILAISGLHISILGYGLFRLFRRMRLWFWPSAGVSVGVMLAYGSMVGASVSTVRALTMFLLGLLAEAAGRTYDLASALAAALIVVLSAWPGQVRQAGLLLSFGAVAGILLFVPAFEYKGEDPGTKKGGWTSRSERLRQWIAEKIKSLCASFTAGIGMQWMLFPLLVLFYYTYPLYSAVLNLLLLPFLPVLFVSGLLGIAVGWALPFPGRVCLLPARVILTFYERACEACSSLPLSNLVIGKPALWKLLFFYGAALLLLFGARKLKDRRLLLLLPVTLLPFLLPINHDLTITLIDVGQGDGIYIETEKHTRILIDGGSTDVSDVGKYRMEPFLKSQGAGVLDYVIVTHGDADHINGIEEIIDKDGPIKIKKLLLPDVGGEQEGLDGLAALAKKRGVAVSRVSAGKTLSEDGLTLICLHPFPGESSDDLNELSTVMKLEYGKFSMLFTGDLGEEGEKELLEAGVLSHVSVLKAGHHGSKGASSEEFLEALSPGVALISCGVDNRYGHPHEETLKRYSAIRCKYYITAESGALTLRTDGKKYGISGYLLQGK